MAEDFGKSVEDGLRLAKRVYLGKDRAVAPPKTPPRMERSAPSYLPTAPMVYAVIHNPAIVDNPDMPSYQPYVHGRCDPPALIPLQMNNVEIDVDCHLDTAFIRVSGSWRVHCVMGSRSCDCRIALPMGEQGSILGVEVDLPRKSYSTELITFDEEKDRGKIGGYLSEDGFLKPNIFTLTIPQIDGGSNILITLRWSQKLVFDSGQFTLSVPFNFPDFVTPAVKKISKKEKMRLNVNSGTGAEIVCKSNSHPLKEVRRQAGSLGFFYEADVLTWSKMDFIFTYAVSASPIVGSVFLQSPSSSDVDQREKFCIHLHSGSGQHAKVFKKDVIFVIDISQSMVEQPLDDTKSALAIALSKLNPEDTFNIIAFNDETYIYSTSMESATKEAVEKAIEWIGINFIAGGGTNILIPLEKATKMLMNTSGRLPIIFLVTDGAVEDDKKICDVMKTRLVDGKSLSPRIYTFGIGIYCNHYFLRTLAMIGRGQYDCSFDLDSIEIRLQKLFSKGLSPVLANVTFESLDSLDDIEVYPSSTPDISSESTLTICGNYCGKFPDTIKARGVSGDFSSFATELKIERAKDIPLDKVLAKQQIEMLTAQVWLSGSKELVEKVAKLSIHTHNLSEYTRMVVLENEKPPVIPVTKPTGNKKVPKRVDPKKIEPKPPKILLLPSFVRGFGDVKSTIENLRPGYIEPKLPEVAEMFVQATSNCCSKLAGRCCCCVCCISCCSKMNDQCAIVLTQLCVALSCFGCFECCSLCFSGGEDGR